MIDQEPPIIKKGTYRHNKSGNLYEVLGVAKHSETGDYLIVYRPVNNGKYEYFVRPYEMFVENSMINGVNMPRFEYIDT